MDRRSFLRTGGLFAVTTAAGSSFLMACAPSTGNDAASNNPSDPSLRNLVFVTPFQHIINYADVYVAIQEGFFEEEGLRIEPIGGSGTASSVSQVSAGQGMFGKAAAVITCPLIADTGATIVTVAQGDQKSQYSVASMPDNPLTHPDQWQNKTIGVISKGGTTELLLDAMSVAEDSTRRRCARSSPAATSARWSSSSAARSTGSSPTSARRPRSSSAASS
ncbi:ABC transporter substrate-binding protein [Actinophytocola sp. S1-96]|uniref:ABC transporter substrate-binding protein n=1 Tax=Actinophytocola gossypii TaxID=2812003 RepID=A0ABT2J253_9PSEU|nr:ABC transporter substrate-binding protein [Actinophytocola gossypii]